MCSVVMRQGYGEGERLSESAAGTSKIEPFRSIHRLPLVGSIHLSSTSVPSLSIKVRLLVGSSDPIRGCSMTRCEAMPCDTVQCSLVRFFPSLFLGRARNASTPEFHANVLPPPLSGVRTAQHFARQRDGEIHDAILKTNEGPKPHARYKYSFTGVDQSRTRSVKNELRE